MMKMTKQRYRAPPGWGAGEKDGYEFHGMTYNLSQSSPVLTNAHPFSLKLI